MAQSSMEEIESNKQFGVLSVFFEFLQTQSAGGGVSRLRHEEPAGKQCRKLLLKSLGGKDSLKE